MEIEGTYDPDECRKAELKIRELKLLIKKLRLKLKEAKL